MDTDIFRDKAVGVIGGGPSLRGFEFNVLRGNRLIAVNSSGFDVPWADVLFFQDCRWIYKPENIWLAEGWRGISVTSEAAIKPLVRDRFEYVSMREGVPLGYGLSPIRWGVSSGHCAVSLAIFMGAKTVILFGFDCGSVRGRNHYHDRYDSLGDAIHDEELVSGWIGWDADAMASGVTILTVSGYGRVDEFQKVELTKALSLLSVNK